MALVNVADFIWNDLAKTQSLRTPWARRAFALNNQQMADLEDADYLALKDRVGTAVASGFINVRPLFFENVAISRYVANHPELRAALPEIVTPEEGALIASMDNWFIQGEEKAQLAALLASELGREIDDKAHLKAMMKKAIEELTLQLGVVKKPASQ